MKQLIHRLRSLAFPVTNWFGEKVVDYFLPWRRMAVRYKLELEAAKKEIELLTRERDTARRQFAETKTVNLTNAAAHRATEVAMLRQNHALQAAEARLAGNTPHPELAAAAKEVPALRVPKYLPVEQPKQISP